MKVFFVVIAVISICTVSPGCSQIHVSSPYGKHFALVRDAAKELESAATRKPFDLEFASEKPMNLQLGMARAEATVSQDPALDANYRGRSAQLLQLYSELTRLGFQTLRAQVNRDPHQTNPYLASFRQAMENTESGYFDKWDEIKPTQRMP
jgi:hypothetical protein